MYRMNDNWTFNAAWVFNSGQAFTAPSGKYQLIDNWIYYYAERNGYRAYNPFLINFEDSENGARTRAVQYSLFGIIPSVAFNIKF